MLPLTENKVPHTHRHPNTQRRSFTLHTQHARQHSSNTQWRRGIAQPPTTASSSVELSHSGGDSAHTTLAAQCCSCFGLLPYSSAILRLRHAQSQDTCRIQRPPQPPTTHAQRNTALSMRRGGNAHVYYAAQLDAQIQAINHKTNPTQRCAVKQQPQRDAVQQPTRDNTYPQSHYCGTAPYSLRSRPRRRCTPKTLVAHRTYDAATILHSRPNAHHAHADQRRTPRYHHTTNKCAQTHTTRQAPPTTAAHQRHGA
jgi:hypothetical protein